MRRTRSQPERLGPLVGLVLDDLGAGDVARVLRVSERWDEAVGAEIAAHLRPTALRGEVLEVTAESSVWAQQLQLRTPEIVDRLRDALGGDAPSDLFFRVGR